MATLQRTWTTSLNNVPASEATATAQAQNVAYQLKTLAVAAGGVVQSSSDGLSASSADWWTGAASNTWNAGGSSHSHVVIRMGTAPYYLYLMISCGTTGATVYQLNIGWSSSAWSGGTTTADPTATGGNTNTRANRQFLPSTLNNCHFHSMRNTAGDWLFFVSQNGSVRPAWGMGFLNLAQSESGDHYPYLTWTGGWLNSGVGAFSLAGTNCGTGGGLTWNNDGTVNVNSNSQVADVIVGGSTRVTSLFTASGSIISGSFPMWAADVYSSGPAKRGTMVDIWLAPTGSLVNQFTEEPASPATSTTAIFGEFWVPNGGVTPS